MEHIETFKEWVETFREDVETVKDIVGSDKAELAARKFAATALNYLVTRMDLVPDWEESVGVLDDVMVLRICVDLAYQHELDEALDTKASVNAARLSNECETIEAFLGAEMYADLRKHCERMVNETTRGRSTELIATDADVRKKLYQEVDADLTRMPAAPMADPEAIAVKFKSYLAAKLK